MADNYDTPAIQRGLEMMKIPMGQLPEAALKYAAYLCKKVGMCGETLLTAYVTYAQVEENLECDHPNYFVTKDHRAWYDEAQRIYHRVGNYIVLKDIETAPAPGQGLD